MQLVFESERNFFFIKSDVLPANIGYVRWDGFTGFTENVLPTCDAAFKFVNNTKAVIVDMRYNGGGSPETVNEILNYFFSEKKAMNHIIDFRHDTTKRYTDPAATKFKLKMPVYILTSKNTFSGAEDFTYAMKLGNRAVVVGDTTGGGAHPTGSVPLGQGFVLNIPHARSYHEITGTNWEGTGVYPDVFVKGEYALEQAQILAINNLLATTTDEWNKKELNWQLNVTKNKLAVVQNDVILTTQELQKFCGEFKPVPGPGASPFNVSIILKGNNLSRSIDLPPDYKLIPISKTRFVYHNAEWNRCMDFILDKDGNVTSITLHKNEGDFSYEKIK